MNRPPGLERATRCATAALTAASGAQSHLTAAELAQTTETTTRQPAARA